MPGQLTHEAVTIRHQPTIDGVMVYNATSVARRMVLLMGPHPLMGGSMENPLISQLADALAQADYLALRFNYRTLEAEALARNMAHFWQTGQAPCDDALIADAMCVHDWLKAQFELPLYMVGYSFGAHVAASLLDEDTQSLVMIAPTVAHHPVEPTQPHIPKLVIHTDNDFATPVHATQDWFNKLAGVKQRRLIPAADHFFKQHQGEINASVLDFFAQTRLLSQEMSA